MESTATNRVWRKGPPPHVGWWNASTQRYPESWRWWDGRRWSTHVDNKYNVAHQTQAATAAQRPAGVANNPCEWTDYWPEAARVPRIDPAVGYLDIGDARWYLREGIPMKGRKPHCVDSSAWTRWAEQRNAMPDPLGLAMRAEPPPLPRGFQGMAHLYAPAKIGRTRMVDGNELTKLAGQAGVIAHEARVLADRLNEMIRTAS